MSRKKTEECRRREDKDSYNKENESKSKGRSEQWKDKLWQVKRNKGEEDGQK